MVELTAAATRALRRSVLRAGTPSTDVVFDGDDLATTFHLGAEHDEVVIAISSWMRQPPPAAGRRPDACPDPAYQLRGMATAPAHRGTGIGTRVLLAGLDRCRAGGATLVWARARTAALGFYTAHGFEVSGDEYLDATTGIPHRDIFHDLLP